MYPGDVEAGLLEYASPSLLVREDIKKRLSFGQCPKGEGGFNQNPKVLRLILIFPILTIFWTLNGGNGGGLTMFQKF